MASKHAKTKKDNLINKKKNNKKGKRLKKFFLLLMQLIFLIMMIYSGKEIYKWWKDNKASDEIIEEIAKVVNNKNEISIDQLKQINDETVAYIKVSGTNIDFPVVQHNDNQYYLTHSFDKSVNGAGWIFADYRDTLDGTDKNLIIYGHNRRDGNMFGTLRNILNQDWYKNQDNLKITLTTQRGEEQYQVFSVYKIENEEYYITTGFKDETYKTFIDTIKNRSIYNFNEEIGIDDNILTLSTCDNNNKYRVVLHAKKIK